KSIGVKADLKCGGAPLVAAQVAIVAKKLGTTVNETVITYGTSDTTGKIKLSTTLPKALQQANDFMVTIKHNCKNGTV
ncbi:hypothetical protein PMAYCL1PPCAC_22094, partial [Pristionchus mayeri]